MPFGPPRQEVTRRNFDFAFSNTLVWPKDKRNNNKLVYVYVTVELFLNQREVRTAANLKFAKQKFSAGMDGRIFVSRIYCSADKQ